MGVLNQYKVFIHVRFDELIHLDDPSTGEGCLGYYQTFGVSAPTEAIARNLAREALDGSFADPSKTKIAEEEVDEIDLATCKREIAAHCEDPDQQCVWFQSGRVFYSAD